MYETADGKLQTLTSGHGEKRRRAGSKKGGNCCAALGREQNLAFRTVERAGGLDRRGILHSGGW